MSDTLIGVDLSPSIIEEAEKMRPNLYDKTYAGDATAVFMEMKNKISMIIAADSYIYFGDLVPLFEAMEVGLVDNGCKSLMLVKVVITLCAFNIFRLSLFEVVIAFTLENAMEDDEIR